MNKKKPVSPKNKKTITGSSWRAFALLSLLWLVVTAYNWDKAYHIDDTAHLEIAEWIAENPLRPMSGLVNWQDSPAPIHELNQPHLYFYLLAGFIKLFGTSEAATHAFQAVLVLLTILSFFFLARVVAPDSPLLLTALFVLGPAFVVSQNLMVDVPLAGLWIGFYWVLIKRNFRSESHRYALAGLIASAALLTKYSSLPLVPVLVFEILRRRHYRQLYLAAIPLLALAAWSGFNYWEYGSVHLLDRPGTELTVTRVWETFLAWIVCLGAVSPFCVLFAFAWARTLRGAMRKVGTASVTAAVAAALILPAVFYAGWIGEPVSDAVLRWLFLPAGAWLTAMLCWLAVSTAARTRLKGFILHGEDVLLHYWFFSGTAFVVLFSPFVAARHALLVLPPVILLLGRHLLLHATLAHKATALAMTLLLTLFLGVSDWQFADLYRTQAAAIAARIPKERKTWFIGHWGWQWYATRQGMLPMDGARPLAAPGDILVVPMHVHQQSFSVRLEVAAIAELVADATPGNYFSTGRLYRFYHSTFDYLPWNLTREPLGSIQIFSVVSNPVLHPP